MPARKKRKKLRRRIVRSKTVYRKNKASKSLFYKRLLVVIFFVLCGATLFVFSKKRLWDGKSRFALVVATKTGDVEITSYNPNIGDIYTVIVPADTEVEVARKLGKVKIKNVRSLGDTEGLGGELLAETVTRYFKLPVVGWAYDEAIGFRKATFSTVISALTKSYDTNMSFYDKVLLVKFVISVKNPNIITVELGETSSLQKVLLKDGTEGYRNVTDLPERISAYFTDDMISSQNISVVMINSSNDQFISDSLGEVIQAYGAKIALIQKGEKNIDLDCEVSAKDRMIGDSISKLFGCGQVQDYSGNFDVQFRYGDKFVKRY